MKSLRVNSNVRKANQDIGGKTGKGGDEMADKGRLFFGNISLTFRDSTPLSHFFLEGGFLSL